MGGSSKHLVETKQSRSLMVLTSTVSSIMSNCRPEIVSWRQFRNFRKSLKSQLPNTCACSIFSLCVCLAILSLFPLSLSCSLARSLSRAHPLSLSLSLSHPTHCQHTIQTHTHALAIPDIEQISVLLMC